MKFIEVHTSPKNITEKSMLMYINVNHILSFCPLISADGKIIYDIIMLKVNGHKDILAIKYNYENFKDNILKLHSNHTHIV